MTRTDWVKVAVAVPCMFLFAAVVLVALSAGAEVLGP